MSVRILLADDKPFLRDEVRLLLDAEPGWRVVAEANGGVEAVQKARESQPDVVVIDYSMPEMDGISAIPLIRSVAPQAEVVVLTVHDARFTAGRAVQAGARGYVVKSEIVTNLIPAVRAATEHRHFVAFPPSEQGQRECAEWPVK